jgi:hypothetical protein
MMTTKLLILTCIIFVCSCSTNESEKTINKTPQDTTKKEVQTVERDTNVQYNVTINDTFFFRRTITPYVDIVFIDKNRQNKFYKELQQKDEIDISSIYEYFKTPLKKINTSSLPDKWIEIIRHKGEFYVNRPSNDWYNLNRFIVNDSLFISCFSDPYIRTLKSLNKIGKKKFELTIVSVDYQTNEKTEEKINIYEIDHKRQVFLFESTNSNESFNYYFATPIKNVSSFDLIDIYNSEMKSFADSYEDTINYKELINSP